MITPAIVAGEVTLRPWAPEEAGLYVSLRDDLVLRFTTEPDQLDRQACAGNIQAALDDPRRLSLAICAPGDEPVGNIEAVERSRHADISYWLGPSGRGKGWASAALRATSDLVLRVWPVDYAQLEIHQDNLASVRVAEAAGFERHGLRLESACGGPALLYRLDRPPNIP